MQNNTPENLILLCGELMTDGTVLYNKDGEDYVEFSIKVSLPTGTDILPIVMKRSMIDDTIVKGATISLTGSLFSEEKLFGEERELLLKVLVGEVYAGETEITSGVFLTGNIIRKPYSYPFQEGERAEFEITVGNETDRLAYVPLSVNNEAVSIAKSLQLGDTVSILGQLHSFEYLDLNDNGSTSKTGYEVEILTFTGFSKV